VNIKEKEIYRFKGLKPRPVKLVKELQLGAHGEAAEPNLLITDVKRTRKELAALLKHELIHYELKEKRNIAQELGIVTSYVLQTCFSGEEYEHIPTVRKTRKVPLPRFKRQVDRWFETLFEEVLKLPDQQKIRIYPYVQNVYVGWAAFAAAVKTKKRHIFHEIWKIKRGLRGKGHHEQAATKPKTSSKVTALAGEPQSPTRGPQRAHLSPRNRTRRVQRKRN
jgi:hypothetical protein